MKVQCIGRRSAGPGGSSPFIGAALTRHSCRSFYCAPAAATLTGAGAPPPPPSPLSAPSPHSLLTAPLRPPLSLRSQSPPLGPTGGVTGVAPSTPSTDPAAARTAQTLFDPKRLAPVKIPRGTQRPTHTSSTLRPAPHQHPTTTAFSSANTTRPRSNLLAASRAHLRLRNRISHRVPVSRLYSTSTRPAAMEGKQWTGVGVRKAFLEYFEQKGHKIGAFADSLRISSLVTARTTMGLNANRSSVVSALLFRRPSQRPHPALLQCRHEPVQAHLPGHHLRRR